METERNKIFKRLIIFLKKKFAFRQYIANIHNNELSVDKKFHFLTDKDYKSFISVAFIWYNTPEGNNFWHKIDCEWRSEVENIKR